ncbi:insulinase family protein [bacterium AH-315-C07]|nr:insulinase family protein [bacterium AH-315-C07]
MATQILNRKDQPDYNLIKKIKLVKAQDLKLDNGIPIYSIRAGNQDIVKIEFIFNAGNWFETDRIIALATSDIINDGTHSRSKKELAELIDYHGAFLELSSGHDEAFVSLYSLTRNLKQILPIVYEIITEANYPQEEINLFIKQKKQQLLINKQKVDFVARKKFYEVIHGSEHPYGYYPKGKDFSNISRKKIIDFYRKSYTAENCKIIVSGKVQNSTIKEINNVFGKSKWTGEGQIKNRRHKISQPQKFKHYIKKSDVSQSGIRIGKVLFNRKHEDYPKLVVLNTVIGGYFGSRLMSNIRENKGYTYGIGSGIVSLQNCGYFFISTEVGVRVCKDTLKQVYFELDRLKNELIPEEELSLVRNYMLGNFLSGINNPFALANKFKNIMLYDLDYSYYDKLINIVRTITTDELRELCAKHLDRKSMHEVVVGGK